LITEAPMHSAPQWGNSGGEGAQITIVPASSLDLNRIGSNHAVRCNCERPGGRRTRFDPEQGRQEQQAGAHRPWHCRSCTAGSESRSAGLSSSPDASYQRLLLSDLWVGRSQPDHAFPELSGHRRTREDTKDWVPRVQKDTGGAAGIPEDTPTLRFGTVRPRGSNTGPPTIFVFRIGDFRVFLSRRVQRLTISGETHHSSGCGTDSRLSI
jgi:hypothetical protein